MALVSGTRIGVYEVIELLGAGGMGEVYRARDPRFAREVAIKVLAGATATNGGTPAAGASAWSQDDRLRRFEQEARAAGALNHPNILVVHDFGTIDGAPYLVSELLVGHTLRDELQKQGVTAGLPVRKAVDYALQVTRGLAAAHEQGIVHRDLKPENVFVLDDGRVKILDFGLAKLRPPRLPSTDTDTTRAHAAEPTGSQPGLVLGTVGYMAPEQVRAEAVDQRADIFSLGVMLFEMLTGRRAFSGDSAVETMNAILKNDPPDVSTLGVTIPAELDRIVRHCLEKRPGERFQSARDLAFHFAGLADASGARPAVPPTLPRPWRRVRELAAWGLAALAAVTAIALAAGWSRSAGEQPPATPLHALIGAPDDAVNAFDRGFALSPDGEYLAFPARDRQGRTLLWLRTMSTGEARPIPGTRDAVFPFWSPDGREVAFWSDRKIKRVEPDGRTPPRAMCDSVATFSIFRGGAWLSDGTIVFADNSGSLTKCGPNTPLAPVFEPSSDVTRYLWPQALPDGRAFLIGVAHRNLAKQGFYRAELDRPLPSVPLVPGLTGSGLVARFARPNQLLWRHAVDDPARGPSAATPAPLVARPFDGTALDPDPESMIAVAPAAGGAVGGAGFDASANGRLVYQRPVGNLSTHWFTRTGVRLAALDVSTQSAYRLSPDGTRLAMIQTNGDLFIADLERGVRTRVTATEEFEQAAMWSADGRRIAFRHVGAGSDLFVHDFTTGRTETIAGGPRGAFIGSDWSKDGRTIVASVISPSTPSSLDLVLFDLASRTTTPLMTMTFNEVHPRFSPDGRMVAYASDETGDRELYVRPITGGTPQRISRSGGDFPMWRGDGTELVYLAPEGTFMSVAVRPGPSPVFADPVALFTTSPRMDAGDFYRFDMTADGQRFMIQLESERPQPLVLIEHWTALLKKL